MSAHVALLGDSVFDNRAYTGGQPEVAAHLRALLPPPWQVTLGAVDGTTTHDMGAQIDRLRPSVDHVVLSLGGNDALNNADLLGMPARSTADALDLFSERVAAFEQSYRWVLEALHQPGRRLTVCTIYNGNLDPETAPRARVGLAIFNDAILRVALSMGISVIELRAVCTEAADFANPIEPSGQGGRKVAEAIAVALGVHPPQQPTITLSAR